MHRLVDLENTAVVFSFCFFGWVGNEHFVEVFFVFCLFVCLFFFLGGGCRVFASESTVRALSLASI